MRKATERRPLWDDVTTYSMDATTRFNEGEGRDVLREFDDCLKAHSLEVTVLDDGGTNFLWQVVKRGSHAHPVCESCGRGTDTIVDGRCQDCADRER